MERTDVLELMSTLKLYGMRAAYDEVMTTGIKRRHEPPRIVGDLLNAEIAEKAANGSISQRRFAPSPSPRRPFARQQRKNRDRQLVVGHARRPDAQQRIYDHDRSRHGDRGARETDTDEG